MGVDQVVGVRSAVSEDAMIEQLVLPCSPNAERIPCAFSPALTSASMSARVYGEHETESVGHTRHPTQVFESKNRSTYLGLPQRAFASCVGHLRQSLGARAQRSVHEGVGASRGHLYHHLHAGLRDGRNSRG